MATYKSKFTGAEIDEKLEKVDALGDVSALEELTGQEVEEILSGN